MIDAEIEDDDFVIIKTKFAEGGKIAVVLIEDEITLKQIHLRSNNNKIELQPVKSLNRLFYLFFDFENCPKNNQEYKLKRIRNYAL